jgi:hypothetical protein
VDSAAVHLKFRKSQVQDKSGMKEVGEATILSVGRREYAMRICLRIWELWCGRMKVCSKFGRDDGVMIETVSGRSGT